MPKIYLSLSLVFENLVPDSNQQILNLYFPKSTINPLHQNAAISVTGWICVNTAHYTCSSQFARSAHQITNHFQTTRFLCTRRTTATLLDTYTLMELVRTTECRSCLCSFRDINGHGYRTTYQLNSSFGECNFSHFGPANETLSQPTYKKQ